MKEIASMHQVEFSYDMEEEESSTVSTKALTDVSFTLYEGEWLAVVGHNGSGKSTLAKLLIGLMFPSSGEVHLFSERLSEENLWETRSRMGIVFQNPDNQFVGSTVQDDVAFALENNGVPHEMMVKRVHEALEQVKMTDYINHEPHHLSGGQKQRVAIAGALALHPELLILDEATSMLDPQGREEVIEIVKKLRSEIGLTVLSITHDLEEVLLADRILVMNEGQVLMVGSPQEIFQRGTELEKVGLDLPFALRVSELLRTAGVELQGNHMTEEELVNELWTYHFSK
ncbi:energy-coupling factor transporter ATPase [Sporosarcina sp. P20a]|uniref:energy-coupling factor ABC transporter ATP-binding protein n=1 Tax=unclassified Sporosarcina TaxID=2647733 RepID=UPI000C164699|nr:MULTISPECIES: energy-coupling factor ABC transporter ATP-binding protein [unclassified Sporosarcina]PIC86020.1 energy-coupling factor transporter ATPase [Sporosarcina sp. P20a]PID06106.1 energy-coupling factor transporter ATPase [Sporosarcina sp. P30]PID09300.1 energy-coupling factor transporter ATPase [Sporosarcina sp. P31]PID12599.1 energy-coupling factor transporter ATPase [Sporosarcina sp. P32b]